MTHGQDREESANQPLVGASRGVTPPINARDNHEFDRIASHYNHKVEVALYGNEASGTVNAAIECVDCGTVIVDADR